MHSNMNTSPAGLSRIGKAERKHKVVVIKVGTSSLLRKGHLHLSMLGALAEACSDLSRAGCKVIVVTSGAVGAGCQVLGAVRAPPFSSNPRISSFRPPLAGTARSPAAAPAARRAKITLFRDETVSRILHGRKDVFVAFAGVSEARARRADRRRRALPHAALLRWEGEPRPAGSAPFATVPSGEDGRRAAEGNGLAVH